MLFSRGCTDNNVKISAAIGIGLIAMPSANPIDPPIAPPTRPPAGPQPARSAFVAPHGEQPKLIERLGVHYRTGVEARRTHGVGPKAKTVRSGVLAGGPISREIVLTVRVQVFLRQPPANPSGPTARNQAE
jgi:hypothetical protein